MKKTKTVPVSESITKVTGRKLDFGIIGALVLALGFVVYNYVLVDEPDVVVDAPEVSPVEKTQSDPGPPVVAEEQIDVLPNSVAVLPFESLSLDPEDAFFAAGLHDELLSQLAKISDLNVIARTSVLRYADTEMPIPEIATELNVESIMEGTVRYAEGSVRVTTQLIDAASGAHLWAETYTRPFENIFEIETDIAMQIASALEAEFSPEEQNRIANTSNPSSPEAFALYIRGKELMQSSGPGPEILSRVQVDLERAIALDSEFAQAHAFLAGIHAEQRLFDTGTPDNWLSRVEELESLALEHVERALELDPNMGYGYSVLGKIHYVQWRGQETRRAHEKALQLSPNDPVVIIEAAWFHSYWGMHKEAIRLAERALELDPNNGDTQVRFGIILQGA
jgi:TolB-like protein